MATLKQKTAFKKTLKNIEERNPKSMGEIMLESGYSKATAINPGKNLIQKKGWQELLAAIDDGAILKRIIEILLDTDKRSSLTAADMLLKLKNKYPDQKTKAMGLFLNLGDE
jgi:hypothetical protein